RYEVHFASARFDEHLFHGTNFTRWNITSLPPEDFVAAAASKARLYDEGLLTKYVAEELRLYEAILPDLVISDLRWSTTISAPAFGVPCATLIDAYWSRRATRDRFPLPDLPLGRLPGASMIEKYFLPIALPVVHRHAAAPVNKLRREYGLPEVGDLLDVVNWGDRVLFPNDPQITPLTYQAPHETFLGPVLWSPETPLPPFWDELGQDRPMIYATVGSSGMVDVVPPVLKALGSMDVDVVFSTGVRFTPKHVPDNVHVVDMIPGDLAARKAAVVICHGGAGPAYQALAEGTPIVGIPSIIDQLLSAIAIRDAGAGLFVRAAKVTPTEVRAAVERVMREEHFKRAAQRVAASFARFDPDARFRAVVDEVVVLGGTVKGR
ncbi:MAG: nucleotide disphospho-sugar-binding domain-containing protein, partial [Halobacteriota archaeon]